MPGDDVVEGVPESPLSFSPPVLVGWPVWQGGCEAI
jgi:hypothetical protein